MIKTTRFILPYLLFFFTISCFNPKNIIIDTYLFKKNDYGFSKTGQDIKLQLEASKDWNFQDNVFYNASGEKIGEFAPGAVDKENKKFDEIKKEIIKKENENQDMTDNLISINEIAINNINMLKVIRSNPAFGSEKPVIWETNKYIIDYNDRYCIYINFYNQADRKIDEAVITGIISSIKIIN